MSVMARPRRNAALPILPLVGKTEDSSNCSDSNTQVSLIYVLKRVS
jgi:hypothetical protein